MTLDGIEVKVGDKLWSLRFGWCIVTDVPSGPDDPFACDTGKYGIEEWAADGKWLTTSPVRDLYWDEVKIVPPPKPKRKVKKEVRVFVSELALNKHENQGAFEYHKEPYSLWNIPATLIVEVEE